MTIVPHPRVSAGFRPEVRLAIVVDLGGEAQQAAVGVGRNLVGGGGQTVLLKRTLQHEHGPVLHVGGLLHHLRVQHQVRSRCGQEDHRENHTDRWRQNIFRKRENWPEKRSGKYEWFLFQTTLKYLSFRKDIGLSVMQKFSETEILQWQKLFHLLT